MKRIFGVICLIALAVSLVFGQNGDNNTYTDNTILGGASDDIFYSGDNTSSQPPQSNAVVDNPNYQNNGSTGPGNSDNSPAIAEPVNPPSGNIAFDNPDYQNNTNIGPGNSDNSAALPETSNPPSGNISYDNPTYNSAAASNNSNYNDGYVNPDNNPAPNYQNFYNQLSPYGTWRYVAGYGNVWAPAGVSAGFSPYLTAGHWVYTEYGWTWVSDYTWGWAPFHYGRWFHDAAYGWLWAPGYQWAPAWVAWGNCNGYYCWAPLRPGYGFGYYRPAFAYWNFIPRGYLGFGRPENYLVNRGRIFNGGAAHIQLVNEAGSFRNNRFFAGPRADEVAHYSGHQVNRVSMATVNRATTAHFNSTAQTNHFNSSVTRGAANNYNSRPGNAQAYRGVSGNSNQYYRNIQQGNRYSQPAQQGYATQPNMQRQSMQAQRNYTPQPVQRNAERSFASAQRNPGTQRSMPSGGFHGGSSGRSSGGGGGGGHGRR